MIGPDFSDTEARLDRVMAFIFDTVAEGRVDEPAGRGAGWSVEYDEAAIRAFIVEVLCDVPLAPLPAENPSEVVGYCWEVNAEHPRLIGKAYSGGGERVTLGQRGPVFDLAPYMRCRPWGLTQIWIMRNGQEVRATWKERT